MWPLKERGAGGLSLIVGNEAAVQLKVSAVNG